MTFPVNFIRYKFLFLGTKWCGLGSRAAHHNDLGTRRETDKCCRAHDMCLPEISPFRIKYGLWNYHPYTLVGCKCERAFKKCLRNAGSAFSIKVYHLYFTILRPKCLKMKRGCVKRRWFRCVKYGKKYYIARL